MLWKTIIKRTEQVVLNNPTDPKVQVLVQHAKELKLSTWLYIRSITPQQAHMLRLMVPAAFPKKLQRLPLKVSQNIHGKWRVDATNKEST